MEEGMTGKFVVAKAGGATYIGRFGTVQGPFIIMNDVLEIKTTAPSLGNGTVTIPRPLIFPIDFCLEPVSEMSVCFDAFYFPCEQPSPTSDIVEDAYDAAVEMLERSRQEKYGSVRSASGHEIAKFGKIN